MVDSFCLSVRLCASASCFSKFLHEYKRLFVGKRGREKVAFFEGKLEELK